MKFLEVVDMIGRKGHQQVCSISFLIRKQDQEKVQINNQLKNQINLQLKNYKEKNANVRFADNISEVDLPEIKLLSSKNKYVTLNEYVT